MKKKKNSPGLLLVVGILLVGGGWVAANASFDEEVDVGVEGEERDPRDGQVAT